MAAAALQAAAQADIVIGAAAPVDFAPAQPAEQKVKKQGNAGMTVAFVPTRDILAEIGQAKRPGQLIVAFAAETEKLLEHAAEKLARKAADLIVANDVTAADAGFAADTNRAILLFADGRREELPLQSKETMAHRILDAVVSMAHPV
jgi:phosphopantothenoylcysteine decarboxylase/phosphopantothenate--cysteine ligase